MSFAATNADYGIFGTLVTIISALMAAAGAILLLWAGPLQKWRPPDAELPDQGRRMIVVGCAVIMALLARQASPSALNFMEVAAGWLIGTGIVLGIIYSALRHGLYHTQVKKSGKGRFSVLGGLWMSTAAKAVMKEQGITNIDDLLDGSRGASDLWSGSSRFCARVLLLSTFILFVVSITVALVEAGLIILISTTGKAFFPA